MSAKIISRGSGQSVVASAAYRSGEALKDNRYGLTHDYSRKGGITHSEIAAPPDAPAWVHDREALWNAVEAAEARKDAQLAREFELALPIELSHEDGVELVRDYVQKHFVAKGMIADFSIHEDDANNPHAHVLLTMRSITPDGFGPKVREWNSKMELLKWREAWAESSNEHLARAGHDVRIDHRTLEAQGIDLIPGQKIGVGRERQQAPDLPRHVAARIAEQERIAHENGRAIVLDPTLALKALTRTRATFTERDLAKFLHTRTLGAEQFENAMLKVRASRELVVLGKDDLHRVRYTTREMLEIERSLFESARELDSRKGHRGSAARLASILRASKLSAEQEQAFEHITDAGDIKVLVGVAGSGKSTLLEAARRAWEAEGFTAKGATLSGIAAENLEKASGIESRTIASYEWAWKEGRDALTRNDVLIIDEAGMLGSAQLERVLAAAARAHSKVVLVGDPEQLQAIEAGAAFRGIASQVGIVEMTEVHRQHEPWARQATQAFSSGRTHEALAAYDAHGRVIGAATREEAKRALLESWNVDRHRTPEETRLILAYTRDDVLELNASARAIRKAEGELGHEETIETARGKREIAVGDRIVFLRNERSLGVKNGSLATVESLSRGVLTVRRDGKEDSLTFDARDYQDLEWGYASTIHKAQGSTLDRSYVLASQYFDRHTTYVALSRHRNAAKLYWAEDEFAGRNVNERKDHFAATLGRARPKDLAHDYLEEGWTSPPLNDNVRLAAQTPERETNEPRLSTQEIQRQARERWQEFRRSQQRESDHGQDASHDKDLDRGRDDDDYGL